MKRLRLWIVLGLVLAGLAVLVASAPRLTCWWLRGRCPLGTPDGWLVVQGAGVRSGPAGAPARVRASPQAVEAAVAAAGAALPGFCFAHGQRAWGRIGGEVPWLLEVVRDHPRPSAEVGLTPLQAGALLARLAADRRWGAEIHHLELDGQPGPDPAVRSFHLRANGAVRGDLFRHLGVAAGVWVAVRELEAELTLRRTGERLTSRLELRRLDIALPGGPLLTAALGPLADRQLRREIERLELPPWLPWDAEVRVRVAPAATVDQ